MLVLMRNVAWMLIALTSAAQAESWPGPAEPPPASFAGQQYVDGNGCAFLRAGTPAQTLWIPRINREGKPLCGFPPSGRRVPITGEPGGIASAAPPASDPASTSPSLAVGGSILIAVGSFSKSENAERAARSVANLGFPIVREQLQRGGVTLTSVLAGPFETASQARAALAALRAAGYSDAVVLAP